MMKGNLLCMELSVKNQVNKSLLRVRKAGYMQDAYPKGQLYTFVWSERGILVFNEATEFLIKLLGKEQSTEKWDSPRVTNDDVNTDPSWKLQLIQVAGWNTPCRN